MKMKSFQTAWISLTLSLGLVVLGAALNASTAIALLDETPGAYQGRDLAQPITETDQPEKALHVPSMGPLGENDLPTPLAASKAWTLVATAPSADECEGEWNMTTSHRSLVCIDGFWHNVDFEHWVCERPNKVVEHRHASRTQEACEER